MDGSDHYYVDVFVPAENAHEAINLARKKLLTNYLDLDYVDAQCIQYRKMTGMLSQVFLIA